MSTPLQSCQALLPRKKYEREFLLGLQFISASMQKPKWLPHISEVVLDKPNKMPLSPLDGGHLRSTNCGPNFTPPFFSRGRHSVGGRGLPPQLDSPRCYQQVQREEPRKILPSMLLGDDVQLNRAVHAWRPAARNLTVGDRGEADPDATRAQELFGQVRSILNKLTPERFHTLTKQVATLSISTEKHLRGVVNLVFEKAVSEPKFCATYANMCHCLRELNVPSAIHPGDTVNFCSLLLDLCWMEFKKVNDDKKIFEQKKKELNAVSMEEKRQRLKEELEAKQEDHRRRLLGNVRLIGELFKLKMVKEGIMLDCVTRLISRCSEEALECLCCLLSTSGRNLDCDKAKPHVDQYFAQMEKIVKEKKTSPRIRFMLQDVLDLRQNNWVPRRADQGPKTIDEVHKEAEFEKQQEELKVQLLPKRDSWGCGGPHPPRGPSGLPQEGDWNSSPISVKNHPMDSSQLSRISKQLGTFDISSLRFSPGGEGSCRSWSRGSNGGSVSRHSGEPEWGYFSSSPHNCYSPLKKSLSFTPPSCSTDCYSRAPQRSSWGQDSGEQSNRFKWPERWGRQSDFSEKRDERGPDKYRPPFRRSYSRNTDECGRDRGSPANTKHNDRNWTRDRWCRDRSSCERGRGNCVTPTWPAPTQTSPDKAGPAQTSPPHTNPGNTSTAQPNMTEDKMEKKSKAIIEEYLHINDMQEALLCVQEMNCMPLLFVFVRCGVETTLERNATARKRMGHLLHQLVKAGTLPTEQYYKGLQEILEVAEDMAIDIPHIWLYLAEVIVPMLHEGGIAMGQLFREVSKPLIPLGKAGVLLVEILLLLLKAMNHEEVGALWKEAKLRWKDFLPEDEDIGKSVTERVREQEGDLWQLCFDALSNEDVTGEDTYHWESKQTFH